MNLEEFYDTKTLNERMDNAMSIIASQIRGELGLSYLVPHCQNNPQNSKTINDQKSYDSYSSLVEVKHAPSNKGVTKWELEMLVRYWIPLKFRVVLDKLSNLSHLLDIKSGLEVSEEVRHNSYLSFFSFQPDFCLLKSFAQYS